MGRSKKKRNDNHKACRKEELERKTKKYEHKLCKARARQKQKDPDTECAKEKGQRKSAKGGYKTCKRKQRYT